MNAPRRIGSILNQLMARRGYAQVESAEGLQRSVAAAVGPLLASGVRAGNVRRGVLQLFASDSPSLQELTFKKRQILKQLQQDHPEAGITDVRMKIGC
ncbi:DUF721 domain-containing protein [Candidatus Laterigemmans baculatus]|uniref:DUF721 domain-containing protein n=1 Tax=Candidatus Laterigemmans baculatus TaxID=2770505 RepID=UPI0013D9F33A|nr:DUF721 domain-containing protein [Candidatus Laterigemmans baculatus]